MRCLVECNWCLKKHWVLSAQMENEGSVGKECLEVGKVVEEKIDKSAAIEEKMFVDAEIGMM
jgi:hypothetical protein